MTNREEIIGYDVEAVESWINENTEGLEPPFEWVQLGGGHSNLTYALTDPNGSRAVVRRPPMGELLPKAHDMGRERRVAPDAAGYIRYFGIRGHSGKWGKPRRTPFSQKLCPFPHRTRGLPQV